jgi:hypothetical protein
MTLQHKSVPEPSFSDFQVLTFYVRRLPADLERAYVTTFLSNSVEGLGPPDHISVFSLASSPVN